MLEMLLLAFVCATSFAATGAVRIYALKRRLIDLPGPRHSHATPTPHGGGLAIAATFLGAALYLFVAEALPTELFMALFGGGGLVMAVGFWDDHAPVPAGFRIAAHFLAAAWALYWLGGFPPFSIGGASWNLGWAGHLIGTVAIVWVLNLYNFMDGIDGIAAVEAVMVAGGACLIMAFSHSHDSLLWIGLLGAAALGFLPWNWPPARIFMGDVGSGFLGFTLAVLAVDTARTGALPIWSWVILLGVFIVDATVTLLTRIVRGERWYAPHRSHAYQQAAARWGSHRRVTLAVLAVNALWLVPLAWIVGSHPETGFIVTGLALMPLLVLALTLGAGRPSARTTR